MKKTLKNFAFLISFLLTGAANAAPITVNFSFDSIAAGSFTFDSSKDGSVIGYSDLSAFNLTFSGLTNSSYDLAFVNSGNDTAWNWFSFNTATNSFLSQNINGFPTTLADIKTNFTQGFFMRDDIKDIRDYAGGGDQYYRVLTISRVPEPASIALLGLGLAGMGVFRKKTA